MDIDALSRRTKNELVAYLVGDQLGTGAFRDVYVHNLDPTLVVKIEEGGGDFSNVLEYETWQYAQGEKKWKKWFAPCVYLGPGSNLLIQKRTAPVRTEAQLPKRIPDFFTDLKIQNFGFIGDQLVCHDYGTHNLWQRGFDNAKLVPANWWSLETLDDGARA